MLVYLFYMTKYLISKSQYDDIIDQLLSRLFKDSELRPINRDKSPWIDDEVILKGVVSGRSVAFRYVSYSGRKTVDDVETMEHTTSDLSIPEPIILYICKLTKVRETKSVDAITNWFEETYNKPIDTVSISDISDRD